MKKRLPEIPKPKLLFVFIFLFSLVGVLPAEVFAQGNSSNKIGVNIGSHLEDFDEAARTVGPGGWVTIMPQNISPEALQALYDSHPEVNIIIRAHWPGTVPNPEQATALAATLGKINTHGGKIFLMPWNEPNMARECGGVGNEADSSDSACAPQVAAYTDALMSQLNSSGLLHHHVEVLSPMINQSAPNFIAFVNALGGANYFKDFYGISMNLYNFNEGCPPNNPICNPNAQLNPTKYREVLAMMGVPNMKVFGIETGNVLGRPVYDATAMFNFLTQVYETWLSDPSFVMASPLTYDPEISSHPMWFWGSAVQDFVEFLKDLSGHPIYGDFAEGILEQFNLWLTGKLLLGELVVCPDGSYAPTLDMCGKLFFAPLFAACKMESNETRNSRPDAEITKCSNCNRTSYKIADCAQSLDAHALIKIKRNQCDYTCNNEYYATQQEWEGNVIINPEGVTEVPFSGKKEEEDEVKYLPDYFEGTHEYYRDYPIRAEVDVFGLKIGDTIGHGTSKALSADHQGVLRKLTPYEFQNELKRDMIDRVEKSKVGLIRYGQVRDYNLEYVERLCWNSPFYLELIEAAAEKLGYLPKNAWKLLDFCLYNTENSLFNHFSQEAVQQVINKIPGVKIQEEERIEAKLTTLAGHSPPSPDEENYQEAWDNWRDSSNGKWWRLWQVAPMVTREDTKGSLTPVPQLRKGEPLEYWDGGGTSTMRFPHLARLFETSYWLQQTLTPKEMPKTSDRPLLAMAAPVFLEDQDSSLATATTTNNGQVLGEVLQEANDPSEVGGYSIKIVEPNKSEPGLYQFSSRAIMNIPASCGGEFCDVTDFQITYLHNGNPIASSPVMNHPHFGDSTCANRSTWVPEDMGDHSPPVVQMNIGDTYGVSISHGVAQQSCVQLQDTTGNCTIMLTADGWTGCITPPPPPMSPIDYCDLSGVPISDYCNQAAITDPNENDTVCGGKVQGTGAGSHLPNLHAVEEIVNPYCNDAGLTGQPGCKCVDEQDCSFEAKIASQCTRFCCGSFTPEVYREVEAKTVIPYLSNIWDHTSNVKQGFFNIFRPESPRGVEPFLDLTAKGKVEYKFCCLKTIHGPAGFQVQIPDCRDECWADPSPGDFYFPLLGGVQKSKEYVSIEALMPFIEQN